jgi:hypothetical protein
MNSTKETAPGGDDAAGPNATSHREQKDDYLAPEFSLARARVGAPICCFFCIEHEAANDADGGAA